MHAYSCMPTYIYVNQCMSMYIHMYPCISMYMSMHGHAYQCFLYAYPHISWISMYNPRISWIRIYVYNHAYICVSMYISNVYHVYQSICINTNIYIYIYIMCVNNYIYIYYIFSYVLVRVLSSEGINSRPWSSSKHSIPCETYCNFQNSLS